MSALTNILRDALHTMADVRRVQRASSLEDADARVRSPAGSKGGAGSKCTPCAAQAYIDKARKDVQKRYGA